MKNSIAYFVYAQVAGFVSPAVAGLWEYESSSAEHTLSSDSSVRRGLGPCSELDPGTGHEVVLDGWSVPTGSRKPPSIVTEYRPSDDEVEPRVRRVSLAELDRRSGEEQAISLVTCIPASFVVGPSDCISLSIEPMSPIYENWRRFWYMTGPNA